MLRRLKQIGFGKPLAPPKQALLFSGSKPVTFYILEEAGVRDPLGEWLRISGALFPSSHRQGTCVGVLIPSPTEFCSHHEYGEEKVVSQAGCIN